ncbi:MAG TPA: DNA polymerase III subunit gamma/tau, partial [Allosphingosinicella sp.]
TGQAWQVRASDEEAEPSLLEQEKAQAEALRQTVLESPVVKAAFEAFPDAELTSFNLDEQRSA